MVSVKQSFFRLSIIIFFVLAILGKTASSVHASEDISLDIFRPLIKLEAQSIPEKTFKESEETYSSRDYAFDLTLPLGKTTIDAAGAMGSQYFMITHFNYWQPRISFLNEHHRFYQGRLSFAGLFLPDVNHLFLVSLGASIAEDEQTVNNPELRPAALGIGLYRQSSSLSYIYGLAYSYAFGRGYLLPILGLNWRLNQTWNVSTLLPAFIKFTQQINPDFKLGYQLAITGDRTRFYNDHDFVDQPTILYLSEVHGKLSAEINYRLSSSFYLFGETGLLGSRKLIFADGKNRFQENDIQYSLLVKIGVRLLWDKNLFQMSFLPKT